MTTQTTVDSRTQHAQRVTRRIKGDLLSLQRQYECIEDDHIEKLSHDIELGLDYNAIINFTFHLKRNGTVQTAYKYHVNSDGEITDNYRSGRFSYDPNLRGTSLHTCVVWNAKWQELEENGYFHLTWTTGVSPSTSHLQCVDDGSYYSGNLGVKREAFLRH